MRRLLAEDPGRGTARRRVAIRGHLAPARRGTPATLEIGQADKRVAVDGTLTALLLCLHLVNRKARPDSVRHLMHEIAVTVSLARMRVRLMRILRANANVFEQAGAEVRRRELHTESVGFNESTVNGQRLRAQLAALTTARPRPLHLHL